MKNKLDFFILKFKVESKTNLILLICIIFYSIFLFFREGKIYDYNNTPIGVIALSLSILLWYNKKSLETFLRFGGSRIRYFKYRLSESVIMSLVVTALLALYYCISMAGDVDYDIMVKISVFYFIYVLLCFSVKIFIELVYKSQYFALGYGVMVFFVIAFRRYLAYLITSDMATIMISFNKVIIYQLVVVIFNIGMSYFTLKTIEIK